MTEPLLSPPLLRLLRGLSLRLKGVARGHHRGAHRSAHRGHGGRYLDARPYSAGDDLRHLDWHALARLDALLIKIYEEPRERTLHVLLDTSASMTCGKELYARQVAASLAWLGLTSSDRVGLYAMGEGLKDRIGPLRGQTSTGKAFSFLQRLSFGGKTDLLKSIQGFSASRPRGSVFLLSDFLVNQDRDLILKTLASSGLRATVIHVLSQEERHPTPGEPLTLVDAETRETMTVYTTPQMVQAYLHELRALEEGLEESCRRYGHTLLRANASEPLENLLFGELLERATR